jgi:malonyl CoA-acyl carrier protein transacylase
MTRSVYVKYQREVEYWQKVARVEEANKLEALQLAERLSMQLADWVQAVEGLKAENERLLAALRAVEDRLLQAPLYKPIKREQEARAIVRAALEG